MKRLIGLLTLSAFLIVSQAVLIHAKDMNIMHISEKKIDMTMKNEDNSEYCNKNISQNEGSCFEEIKETKWIITESNKVLDIIVISIFFLIANIGIILKKSWINIGINILFSGPSRQDYISLFGIIRNLN